LTELSERYLFFLMSTNKFRVNLFRALWGVIKQTDGPMDMREAIPKIAKMGYTGIELPVKLALDFGKKDFINLLADHNLKWIPMVFSSGPVAPGFEGAHASHPRPGRSVQEHYDVWKAQIEEALSIGSAVLKINCHTGSDFFRMNEVEQIFSKIVEYEKSVKMPIMHETHRKRILHSPWHTREILPKFPQLKIVADLSHFICVAETDTKDEELTRMIESMAPQVHHIHSRIGYDHGPQVTDPRAPEWLPYTEGHEKWWDFIVKTQMKNPNFLKENVPFTFTPEHGPPNYQVALPYTRQPLASIWEVNTFLTERLKQKYSHLMVDSSDKQGEGVSVGKKEKAPRPSARA